MALNKHYYLIYVHRTDTSLHQLGVREGYVYNFTRSRILQIADSLSKAGYYVTVFEMKEKNVLIDLHKYQHEEGYAEDLVDYEIASYSPDDW